MKKEQAGSESVDAYIATFPAETQAILESLRATIRAAAPEAHEKISYQMPAFEQHGYLVYYAAWKTHIGFYPASSGIDAFKDELSQYEWAKGTIKFPLDKPLPMDLITRIVKMRVAENLARTTTDHRPPESGERRA